MPPRWKARPVPLPQHFDEALPLESLLNLVRGDDGLILIGASAVHFDHRPVSRLIQRTVVQKHTIDVAARFGGERHLDASILLPARLHRFRTAEYGLISFIEETMHRLG